MRSGKSPPNGERGTTAAINGFVQPVIDRYLRRLAGECREVLRPETALSYAADWSEYFGHQPADGSGDVFFHLDPLWADDAIDFVGIDTTPSGFVDGKDTAGTTGGTVTNDQIAQIALAAGQHSQENNFGELRPSEIRGFVYCDDDNDGIKDAGEPGLGGVTVSNLGGWIFDAGAIDFGRTFSCPTHGCTAAQALKVS